MFGNLDPKINLANMRQRTIPVSSVLNVLRIVPEQLLVKVRVPTLNREEKKIDEIQER